MMKDRKKNQNRERKTSHLRHRRSFFKRTLGLLDALDHFLLKFSRLPLANCALGPEP
jgi:hypothetical protein